MIRKRRLIVEFILLCYIFSRASAVHVLKESRPKMCQEFVCTRQSLRMETQTFVEAVEDKARVECTNCNNCRDTGYSVCLEARGSSGKCLCAQEVPRGCTSAPRTPTKPVPEQQHMDVCYSPAIRNPPSPSAANEQEDIVVTIDQFWREPYWRHMKLENLTLFYEFPIHTPHVCEGTITTVKNQSDSGGAPYHCTSKLHIELEEEEESVEPRDESEPDAGEEAEYDGSLAPEIQFEKAVFDGAPHVRFYYTIQVRRERQLSLRNQLVDRLTMLTSDDLKFYVDSGAKPASTSATQASKTNPATITTTISTSTPPPPPPPINKVEIEQRPQRIQPTSKKEEIVARPKSGEETNGQAKNPKSTDATQKSGSFLDEHLNNGGQLKLVIFVSLITLGVCLLLLLATFLYRRHFGNNVNKRPNTTTKIPATKQVNGYEYRATTQEEK